MSDERALLTKRQREILSGDADISDNYRYKVESQVRTRIREELPEDIEVLAENYPELLEEIQKIVSDK